MSHLNRFYELKAKNDSEPVSFDCLLADFENAKTDNQFFKLTVCSRHKIQGKVFAENFGYMFFSSDEKYQLTFDYAVFVALQREIAIDVDNLEIVIVYGV